MPEGSERQPGGKRQERFADAQVPLSPVQDASRGLHMTTTPTLTTSSIPSVQDTSRGLHLTTTSTFTTSSIPSVQDAL